MPTPLVNGDILRVVLASRMADHAQAGLNVVHYRVVAAAGTNLENVPTLMWNRFSGPYTDWLPTIATFSGVSVTRVATPTRPTAGPFYRVLNGAGHVTGGVIPLQGSGLIRLTTPGDDQVDPPIKPSKGRVYLPFCAATSYSSTTGMLNGVGLGRLNSVKAVLGPEIILTGGLRLQLVLKRTKTNEPPAPPTLLGYTDVTELTGLSGIATQRRRGDFGRLNAAFGGAI